jgi:hypothetical protein
MNGSDFGADRNVQDIFAALLNEMIVVHGCTLEEAFQTVHNEMKLEYDRRVYARRAALRVISRQN